MLKNPELKRIAAGLAAESAAGLKTEEQAPEMIEQAALLS